MAKPRYHVFVCVQTRAPGHPRGCCQAKGGADLLQAYRDTLDAWKSLDSAEAIAAAMQRDGLAGKTCRLACQTQVFGDAIVAPL